MTGSRVALCLLAVQLGFGSAAGAAEHQAPSAGRALRPNFLVINLDDARADGLDRMPILQARVRSEGLDFVNAFTPFPVCCPSRASLLTGNRARRHGVLGVAGPLGGADRFRELGGERQTIAVWLQNAGYQTGLFGKYLNSYDQSTEGQCGTSFHVPPGWTRWRALLSSEQYGGVYGAPATLVDENRKCTFYEQGGCSGNGAPCCIDSQCEGAATCTNPSPESRTHNSCGSYTTNLTAKYARAFISDSVAAGKNFFAYWAPLAPHVGNPGLTPKPEAAYHDALANIPAWRPPNYNVVHPGQPRWMRFAPRSPLVAAATDTVRQNAYETLLSVDHQIGQFLDQLASLGVADDTLILVTSDNGASWGEHGWFFQRKSCPLEECQRVPFLVRYPRGIAAPGTVRDAAVLNIDIAPTVADLAGVELPVVVDGTSAAAWIVGPPPRSWRDDYLIEFKRSGRGNLRGDNFEYRARPSDGDQIRVFHGNPMSSQPRDSTLFEFDSDKTVSPGTVAVRLAADTTSTFHNLRNQVIVHVPFAGVAAPPGSLRLVDRSPERNGLLWWIEKDARDVIDLEYQIPDYVGVRDVSGGYTWVAYETGERELYDLNTDPFQMKNVADDPAYAAARKRLEARLDELLAR
jgi:N-acetylglucosamine-6-sulfatase